LGEWGEKNPYCVLRFEGVRQQLAAGLTLRALDQAQKNYTIGSLFSRQKTEPAQNCPKRVIDKKVLVFIPGAPVQFLLSFTITHHKEKNTHAHYYTPQYSFSVFDRPGLHRIAGTGDRPPTGAGQEGRCAQETVCLFLYVDQFGA
jgi:hypothetical protein